MMLPMFDECNALPRVTPLPNRNPNPTSRNGIPIMTVTLFSLNFFFLLIVVPLSYQSEPQSVSELSHESKSELLQSLSDEDDEK